jgi:hypothetical protein
MVTSVIDFKGKEKLEKKGNRPMEQKAAIAFIHCELSISFESFFASLHFLMFIILV